MDTIYALILVIFTNAGVMEVVPLTTTPLSMEQCIAGKEVYDTRLRITQPKDVIEFTVRCVPVNLQVTVGQ